ncbi:myrosinase 1-like [Zerene cesonia]|uniref:myrosinase 1-like n=1 Tax=Zerene cesonia TaxID=33412 RepID=UPI0018E50307|nr:myrosinase 1-like [Zerene cesonia]
MTFRVLVVFGVLYTAQCTAHSFPPSFKFGAATSAYQIEGAWNVSGKGLNIWDTFTHDSRNSVVDRSSGDIACDSYHLWRKDVDLATELGLQFYRFSISWSRLLPTPFRNEIDEDGAAYYNNLINELLKRNIEPVITLYHYDLPQALQDFGGWLNPLIADWFASYAKVAYSLYADRVKTWLTINEPSILCDYIYNTGKLPPMIYEPMLAPYLCNKNVLLAHAKAWRIYDEEYKPIYKGRVSIANNPVWIEPASPEYENLAELAREFGAGRYSHPIYSQKGGWPPSVERHMAELSKKQGYPESRLPAFSIEEIELIRGTYDYYGLNHYTSRVIRSRQPGEQIGPWIFYGCPELDAVLETPKSWPTTDADDVVMYPEGIRRQLEWLHQKYGNITFLITENGCASRGDDNDEDRIAFIKSYLEQVSIAIKEGINVEGYTVWSLMDNFEWLFGYKTKYGLYKVDFNDPQRRRTPRASAHFYANIIKARNTDVPTSQTPKRQEYHNHSNARSLHINILLLILFWLSVK